MEFGSLIDRKAMAALRPNAPQDSGGCPPRVPYKRSAVMATAYFASCLRKSGQVFHDKWLLSLNTQSQRTSSDGVPPSKSLSMTIRGI